MPKKKELKERIFLRNNWQRRNEIEDRLRRNAEIANNTVIPMCKELGMTVLLSDVLRWVHDKDDFREAFISKCKREAGVSGKYIGKVSESAAWDDFTNRLKCYPYPFILPLQLGEDERKLLSIKEGRVVWSDEQLTEFTNIYLTDKAQIEVYHRIEELCNVLDAFFGDKMPVNDALNSWANIVYPTGEGFKVNPRTEFKKLIPQKKKL